MSNLITLKIEGVSSQDGHVLIGDFIERMENLLLALDGIDRIVGQSGQPTLNYRIVKATHDGPLTVTLEPVLKEQISTPEPEHIAKRHELFFREMNAISEREPVSPEIDEIMLGHLQMLVEGVGKEFQTASISNGAASVELDARFEMNVRRLLDEEDASYGSEEGKLEALDIHGSNRRCWIYPRMGPQRIRCDFLPGASGQIRDNLGKFVRVEGMKFFRPNSPFAFRVAVREIEELLAEDATPVYLKDIQGIAPRATEGLGAVEFVRKLRDEWD